MNATPGGRHEDLMVLYQAAPGSFRAIYTEDVPGRPRFRLSYVLNPDDTLMNRFEIAPPGADFRTYLEGTARRSPPRP